MQIPVSVQFCINNCKYHINIIYIVDKAWQISVYFLELSRNFFLIFLIHGWLNAQMQR